MAGVKFVDVHGKQVLLMDFTHLKDATLLATQTEEAIAMGRSASAPHSVLALLDLTGTPLNRALLSSLRKLSQSNGPFIEAMAFAGLGAVPGGALRALLRVTQRTNHMVFETRAEALDWLTSQ